MLNHGQKSQSCVILALKLYRQTKQGREGAREMRPEYPINHILPSRPGSSDNDFHLSLNLAREKATSTLDNFDFNPS